MSGMPGRSGRRRKPIADHIANGTYRPGKHGPKPVSLPAWPPSPLSWPQTAAQAPPWQPDGAVLAALGDAGRHFLTSMVNSFAIDIVQGALLVRAAETLDDLTVWRATAATDPKAATVANTCTRTFASLLLQASLR
jgi:hypothetical protein